MSEPTACHPLPMSCAWVAEHLSEYLDGELEGALAERVRRHLGACTGCARFAAELAATILALRRLSDRARGTPRDDLGT
jgi:anti-sigma factor RsiW